MGRLPALIGRRLWQLLPIVVFATFVVYSLLQLVPGDPALTLAGDYASKERIARSASSMSGFDRAVRSRSVRHLALACAARRPRPLAAFERAGARHHPAAVAEHDPDRDLCAPYCGADRHSARRLAGYAHRLAGRYVGLASVASLGVALPSFWLGILLVVTFSLQQHWFPATGAVGLSGAVPGKALLHATLPAVALAVGVIAELARQVRSALIEVLNSQYIRTLRAKGLGPAAILWKHGMRNVGVTLLTLLGLQVNRLFSGAVVIEAVFAIPGVGSFVAYSAINKDFPVVQGIVLVLVVIVIVTNLIVDVLNALLDPRVAQA